MGRRFDPEGGRSYYERSKRRPPAPPKVVKSTPPPPPAAPLTPLSPSMHFDWSWAHGDKPELSYDVVEGPDGYRYPVMPQHVDEPTADVVGDIDERWATQPDLMRTGHEQWHGFGQGKLAGVQPTYYALRCFSLDGSRVRGVIFSQEVHPGVNVAKCMSSYRYYSPTTQDDHDAPDARCGCGFYAYLDGHDDAKGLSEYAGIEPVTLHAIVALSGKRLVGTKGLRAERMRVVAFVGPVTGYLSGMSASFSIKVTLQAKAVAARFGVPYFDKLDAALAEYPLTKLSDEQQRWRYEKTEQQHD